MNTGQMTALPRHGDWIKRSGDQLKVKRFQTRYHKKVYNKEEWNQYDVWYSIRVLVEEEHYG